MMTVRFDNFSERADYSPYGVARQRPPADLNGDGAVDGTDQLIFFNAWGAAFGPGAYNPDADINFDGQVNGDDFLILSNNFGADPAPPGAVSQHGNTVGYSGYIYDDAINMSLARFRWFDAETGRWATRDPIGYMDGSNRYQYVRSNPAKGVDPMGLYMYLEPDKVIWYHPRDPGFWPAKTDNNTTINDFGRENRKIQADALRSAMNRLCETKGNCSGCTVSQCKAEAAEISRRFSDIVERLRDQYRDSHGVCTNVNRSVRDAINGGPPRSGSGGKGRLKCWDVAGIDLKAPTKIGRWFIGEWPHKVVGLGHRCSSGPDFTLDPWRNKSRNGPYMNPRWKPVDGTLRYRPSSDTPQGGYPWLP